jgi:hypothetical protein
VLLILRLQPLWKEAKEWILWQQKNKNIKKGDIRYDYLCGGQDRKFTTEKRRGIMFIRKAYSMALWTVTLAIIIGALAIIRVSFRRAVQHKVQATADYMFWTQWGDSKQQHSRDPNSASKITSSKDITNEKIEKLSGEVETYSKVSATDTGAFSGVAKGAEALLKTYDLNR